MHTAGQGIAFQEAPGEGGHPLCFRPLNLHPGRSIRPAHAVQGFGLQDDIRALNRHPDAPVQATQVAIDV
ncbi:MAG: hypothetical protein C4311_10200 [Chloroflexota bacterium]